MLKSTEEALSQAYRLALLDLDGVVYYGKQPVDHASESIRVAESLGMTIEYTTNNSSRMQSVVADQLRGFGLDVEPWQVITSSVVAARMVARHVPKHANVLVLGAEHLRDEVRKQGLQVVESVQEEPVAAIQGWYPHMNWEQMANIAFAVEAGAQYFATNRDLTIPRERGIAPGCGSMIQAVVNATGVEPIASAGKPESAMYDEARVLAAREGENTVSIAESLAIGDRLDTDIEAGNRGGYDSLLVLTGVTDERQVLCATPELRPTYIAQDLRGLNIPQPPVTQEANGDWQCGSMIASYSDGRVQTTDSQSIDALRAACALVWHLMDEGIDLHAIELPQFHVNS